MEVQLISNRTDDKLEKGQVLPYLVQTEEGSSISVLVDSKDRISGSASDFRASFRHRVPRVRYIELQKCILPKIPNVNPNNYSIQIKHDLGTTQIFNLPTGIYNTTTLANQLTSSINAQFVIDGIADTVTCTYDPNTRTFSISSVGGDNFFIVDSCSFITYGQWLAPFESQPISDAPSKTVIYSGIASMLYTRYITVASQALNSFSYGSSVTSRASQPTRMVGVVDLCDIYTAADFDISVPYSGVYKTLSVDGCRLSVANSQRSLVEEVDISVQDEYGLVLDTALSLGAPYPANKLGLVFIFDCSF